MDVDEITSLIEIGFQIGTAVVAAAAVITAATPTKKDDAIFAAVRKVLDVLAFNVGHAKNKDSK